MAHHDRCATTIAMALELLTEQGLEGVDAAAWPAPAILTARGGGPGRSADDDFSAVRGC